MRVTKTRTETERGKETELETETERGRGKGRERTTNAGMGTAGQGAAGQEAAGAHVAAADHEKGGANGQSSDGTVLETTLFHLPFTTCTLLQLRSNRGPTDVVTTSQVFFFEAHLHLPTVMLKGDHDFCSVVSQSAVRLAPVKI